ncbi:MAG TPA: Wzz/FepE/Etk N-terminal domain-containing protein, partial [Beijerinckiaceae bacterium]|nr:Wzz/FepE/Etk N-terminal domain-containing protein [Beijerinckiaceae bacterium]
MRLANSADFEPSPEAGRSFGSIFNELNRKKRWILLPAVVAFICAAAFVNIVRPKYTGEARVFLENRENYFTRPDKDSRGSEQAMDSEGVQSQVQMVMSRDLALRVIKKLDLASREEFDSVKKEVSTLRRVLSLLGLAKDPLANSPEERVLENYYDRLLVLNVGKSRVISVEFSSRDPELAYKTANAIAEEYIALQRDAKKSTTQGASAWLGQAIEPLRAKVAEAEAKVEAFRAQNGLLIGASNATIATQQLGEMNTQMSNARSMQSDLQAKAKIIREALKSGRIFETSEVVNNELVRRLLEQRVAMKTQIALEERSLLPGHPRMKELNAQLSDLESQIRTAAERTARTLENDARVAGARLQSLQSEFEAQKKTSANANEHEVQLRALEREARALRENYEQYLTKYRDSLSRDSDAAAPADARIISRAVLPMLPAFPKKVPIILFSTLATMVLAIGIITTRFMFDVDKAPGAAELPPEVFSQPVQQPMAYQPATVQAPEPAFQEPIIRPPPQAEDYPEHEQPRPAAASAAQWQPAADRESTRLNSSH